MFSFAQKYRTTHPGKHTQEAITAAYGARSVDDIAQLSRERHAELQQYRIALAEWNKKLKRGRHALIIGQARYPDEWSSFLNRLLNSHLSVLQRPLLRQCPKQAGTCLAPRRTQSHILLPPLPLPLGVAPSLLGAHVGVAPSAAIVAALGTSTAASTQARRLREVLDGSRDRDNSSVSSGGISASAAVSGLGVAHSSALAQLARMQEASLPPSMRIGKQRRRCILPPNLHRTPSPTAAIAVLSATRSQLLLSVGMQMQCPANPKRLDPAICGAQDEQQPYMKALRESI